MNEEIKPPEETFKAILNNIKEGYFEVDLKGNLSYFNDTLCNLTGFSKDKLLGLNYKYLTDEENRKKIFDGFNTVYKTGKPLTDFQYQFKDKHGRIIIGETSVYLKYDSKGNKIGFYGLFRDITTRKEKEDKFKEELERLVDKRTKELKELEEKFRTLAEQSFLGIAIIQDNLVKYVNKGLTETFGYSLEEIMKWQPGEFLKTIHPEDRIFVTEQVRKKQIGEPNVVDQYQFRGIKKNGNAIWLEVFSKTINYERKPADFITLIDITEKKIAEEKLKASEKEYQEAFNRSNFYKDLIAHDINNILQNILSSVELSFLYLDNAKNFEDLKRMLEISKEQVNRGANIISNVRKLSELEETESITRSIEAIEVLNKSIKFILRSFQKQKIKIEINNPYKVITVQGNELLTDIFENILGNAVKHNQNPSIDIKIKISKTQKEGANFIKFEFEDNGVGIPDVDKEIIFQRVYNTDKSVRGMGIGLSLVKKIIDLYNGQIWVEDKVQGDYSKGSIFIVLIPEVEVK
ncbi:MAG: PAS domain S-box protein [Promethearchaeota archaeon]